MADFGAMEAAGAPRWSIFFLMQAKTGLVRAWMGAGDFYLPPDDVDLEGGIYKGIGLVGDVPVLSQLVGAIAERVEFVMNGVSDEILSLADSEAEAVLNVPVNVGYVDFDTDWQPVEAIDWMWDGTADRPSVTGQASDSDQTQFVSLSVGSAFTDQTRPELAFYTDGEQRLRDGDTFCMNVAGYAYNSTVTWPAPD